MIRTPLLPDQVEALGLLPERHRFVLADSTGGGKTLTILASFDKLWKQKPERHLLVLTSKSAAATWEREIPKHTNFRYDFHTSDEHRVQEDPHITVVSYPSMEVNKPIMLDVYAKHFGSVILVLEEAHYCKSYRPPKKSAIKAKREGKLTTPLTGTLLTDIVAPLVAHSEYVWAMTATPFMNKIEDLFGLFDLLLPGFFGTVSNFRSTYLDMELKERYTDGRKYMAIKGYKNLDQLKEKIAPYYLKRVQNYNVEFLPHRGDMTTNETRLYLQAAAGILGADYRDFAGRLPDLQRVVDNAVVGDGSREQNFSPGLSTKEQILIDGVTTQLTLGEAVIIFADLHDTIDRLERVLLARGVLVHRLDATASASKRKRICEDFQPGSVLLMTAVGRESLNLQQSHIIWIYDIPFSMGACVQLIGRIARVDSKFDVFEVHFPLMRGTIDEYKAKMFLHKTELFSKVLRGEATMPRSRTSVTKKQLEYLRRTLLWRVQERD
jgi:superfamily II DNA or RNA helicase